MNRFGLCCVAVLLFAPAVWAETPYFLFAGEGKSFWASGGVPDEAFKLQSKVVEGGRDKLKCFAFAPDGEWIFLLGDNGYDTSNVDLPTCKKLSELAKDPNADFKCVAFSPNGGWTIFWNQNGNWTAGDVPDAALKKIAAVAKEGGTLRLVAYGPKGAWVLAYDKTGITYGNVPKDLAGVLDICAKKGIGVRCVAFTGNDWVCLADGNWWTSNLGLAASKRIEQNFKENNPPTWLSFMPSLEAVVDFAVAKAGVTASTPGVAVCVIEGNKVVFRKGYGLANLGAKTPVRPETTFELGSITKSFTGMAISILHDRGELSFDDPVRKYIPELPDAVRNMSIRDMLNHITGLPDFNAWPIQGRDPNYLGNEDYAKAIKDDPKLVTLRFPIGQKYEYSNTNFMLLGLIVQRVSKKRYGTFVEDEILKPLGMTHSWDYDHPRDAPKDSKLGYLNALGYSKDGNPDWTPSYGSPPFRKETILAGGAGNIQSSVDDMAHWDEALRDRKLLKPGTWTEVFKPSKTRDGKTNDYGFGWSLFRDDQGKLTMFGHNGFLPGFATAYYRSIPGDFAVIALSNGFSIAEIHSAAYQYEERTKKK
jgi:CubicO group peptidase (beta-lactamase class C family)